MSESEPSAPSAAPPLVCRGVRGATTVTENTASAILEATRDLLERLVAANGIELADIASVFFTATADVTAEYPALAARQIGWQDVALMCGQEMAVVGSLSGCIRVLLNWNTARPMTAIQHVYVRGAVGLRPDRSLAQGTQIQPWPQATPDPSAQGRATL